MVTYDASIRVVPLDRQLSYEASMDYVETVEQQCPPNAQPRWWMARNEETPGDRSLLRLKGDAAGSAAGSQLRLGGIRLAPARGSDSS